TWAKRAPADDGGAGGGGRVAARGGLAGGTIGATVLTRGLRGVPVVVTRPGGGKGNLRAGAGRAVTRGRVARGTRPGHRHRAAGAGRHRARLDRGLRVGPSRVGIVGAGRGRDRLPRAGRRPLARARSEGAR